MMHVFFTDDAEEDLIAITEYTIKNWGIRQADKYNLDIENTYQIIKENPFNLLSKSRENILNNLRSINVGKHAIFYRIIDDKTIEILRILHLSMDFKRHF